MNRVKHQYAWDIQMLLNTPTHTAMICFLWATCYLLHFKWENMARSISNSYLYQKWWWQAISQNALSKYPYSTKMHPRTENLHKINYKMNLHLQQQLKAFHHKNGKHIWEYINSNNFFCNIQNLEANLDLKNTIIKSIKFRT